LDLALDWDIVRREMAGTRPPSAIAGEVWYGMNSGAKNSLDRNYLSTAEATGYVDLRPLHWVKHLEQAPDGQFRIMYDQIDEQGNRLRRGWIRCRRLFLAAGSIGTAELLLRAKAQGGLPKVPDSVGQGWGTNGDAIAVALGARATRSSEGGPGVVAIEHFDNPIAPTVLEAFPLPNAIPGSVNHGGLTLSRAEGRLIYKPWSNRMHIDWPVLPRTNLKNRLAMRYTNRLLREATDIRRVSPSISALSVHPLGGVSLGDACSEHGELRGHPNLFVVDGSLLPGNAALTNPSLTIAALAEYCMDRILERAIASPG
jgi:cholesterol oxidase